MQRKTEFELNAEMEQLAQMSEKQPEVFAQFPTVTKMALGHYLDSKKPPTVIDLPAASAELEALKTRSESATIKPHERMSLGHEILVLEKKINEGNK